MIKNLLRDLLKIQFYKNRSAPNRRASGFTMIELLVGTVIAFIIITPLLGMVIGLLNDDQKESAKANTEQEIQSALDYISEDLKQAVYIYDKKRLEEWKKNQPNALPFPTDDAQGTPILVFWKRELIPDLPGTRTITGCTKESDTACDDQFVLSLVAYYSLKDTNTTWCPDGDPDHCPVRITRYEIDSYNNRDKPDPPSPAPPITVRVFPANPDIKLNPTKIIKGTGKFPPAQVLVNYLDYSANKDTALSDTECINALGISETQWNKDFTDATSAETGMFRITDPSDPDADPPQYARNSFYVCVDKKKERTIVQITMRGNALRRIQKDADYKPEAKSYFPRSTVTVQGSSNFLQ
jgi:type II secretory pathway pseudopilin PulG